MTHGLRWTRLLVWQGTAIRDQVDALGMHLGFEPRCPRRYEGPLLLSTG